MVIALCMVFVIGNIYVLVSQRSYFYAYNVIPLGLFLIYFAVYHLQHLVLLLAFCTPLAVTLREMGLTEGVDLSLPTEPLMALIMFLYILNQLSSGIADRNFLRHPVTRLIIFQLIWMFITTLTSEDVFVSIKYLLSRLWFIFSCYIIIPHLFQSKKNVIRFVYAYAFALALVVAYTTMRHLPFNFNDKAADWVVSPFYNDHTAYGAALAMFIPVLLSFSFLKGHSKFMRFVSFGLVLVFATGIILSYARAGWLSLIIALGIYTTLLLKIRFKSIITFIVVTGTLFLLFQTEIIMALSRNETDAKGSFGNNVESVSNISTDASNLERLNRWSCAIRMWEERPLNGWGPGTYMFYYAPFQLSRDLTIISTNFGTNGNAHSEYLGPLAEQGLPGILLVVALLLSSTALGYRMVYSLKDRDDRVLCIGLFLGLMTYFVHGLFNNFLDTDKLSLPFWAFLAALVSFDLYYQKKEKTVLKN